MRKLSILPFQTESTGKYIYDGNTRTVIPANSILTRVIELYENNDIETIRNIIKEDYPKHQIDGILKFVERWSKKFHGFYRIEDTKNQIEKQVELSTERDIEELLSSGMMFQMTLNVTEDCNLRCKYCFFSDAYKYNRINKSGNMNFDTAAKALDYYFEFMGLISKRIPSKKAALCFYGGEPLMNIKLIREVVEYAKKNSPVPLIYNLTTNAILLSDEIIDFFAENNFCIAISLDGIKENHDRNRLLANGQGSYDIVMKNILRFKERHPNYSNLVLISVYDWKTNHIENDLLFEQNDLPPIVFLSGVADYNTDYYNQFTEEDKKYSDSQMKFLTNKYIEYRKMGKRPSTYLQALFDGFILTSVICRTRQMDAVPKMLPYTSTCVPGMKISVRTDGIFDICERVNSTMPTGNIETGLNYKSILEIIKKYNKGIFKNCFYCPIRNNCGLCYGQCMDDNDFSVSNDYCNTMVKAYKEALAYAFTIFEARPDVPLNEYIDKPTQLLSLLYR